MFLDVFFTHVAATIEDDALWHGPFALDNGEDAISCGVVVSGTSLAFYGRHRKNLVDIDTVVAHSLSGLFYGNRQRQTGRLVGPKEEQVLFDCGVGV